MHLAKSGNVREDQSSPKTAHESVNFSSKSLKLQASTAECLCLLKFYLISVFCAILFQATIPFLLSYTPRFILFGYLFAGYSGIRYQLVVYFRGTVVRTPTGQQLSSSSNKADQPQINLGAAVGT